MSEPPAADRTVTLAWGDGDHAFNLKLQSQIEELEDKCGCGIAEIFNRLREGRWKLADVRESIRIGLIGGGKTPVQALALVKRYIDERPLAESVLAAQMTLMATIVGAPSQPPAEPEAKPNG
jgi:hypothetical protein